MFLVILGFFFLLLILICSSNVGFIPLKDYDFVDLILFISNAFLYQFSHFLFLGSPSSEL